MLKSVYTNYRVLVNETNTKIAKVGSRHTIYLEKSFVEDSAFPFKADEPLKVKIEGSKLVVSRGK